MAELPLQPWSTAGKIFDTGPVLSDFSQFLQTDPRNQNITPLPLSLPSLKQLSIC